MLRKDKVAHEALPQPIREMTKFYLPFCAMAAAALLPCHAAQPPATAVFQELASAPQAAPATPSQRAAVLGSLALLPADTQVYVALTKPGQSVKDILALPIVRELLANNQDVVPPLLMEVRDSVVGLGPGTAEMLQRMNSVSAQWRARQMELLINSSFGSGTNARETSAQVTQAMIDIFAAGLAKEDLSVTVINQLDANMMAVCKSKAAEFLAEIRADKKEGELQGIEEFHAKLAGHDFSGWKINLAESLDFGEKPFDAKTLAPLKGRSVYVLWAFSGDRLILTVTQNPAAQVHLAKTPAESVLAGAKSSFADGKLASDVRLAVFADAAVVNELYDYYKQDYKGTSEGISRALSQNKGMLGAPQVAGLQGAFGSLCGLMTNLMNDAGKGDATLVAWKQDGLRMEATCGSTSLYNLKEPLQFTSVADMPGNVFYVEGATTPKLGAIYTRMLGDVGKIAWYGLEAAANIEKAQSPDRPGQLQTGTMMMHMISPALDEFWASWQRLVSGLGRHWALAGDLVAPAFPAGDTRAKNFPPSPRVAAYLPVTDRAAVVAGWQGMVNAADKIGGACGMQPGMVATMVQGAETDRGDGVTDYGLSLGGMTLLSSLSNKALVLGNSPDLNGEVLQALSKPASSLRGEAACVRFGPLADMMKKLGAGGVEVGCLDPESFQNLGTLLKESVDGVFALSTEEGERMRTRIYVKTK